MSAVRLEWRPCVRITRCTFLWCGSIGGVAQRSWVVSFFIVRPGEDVMRSFPWAALRVSSRVWPRVIIYDVGAFAKMACEAISIIHVRLYLTKPQERKLFIGWQFCPERSPSFQIVIINRWRRVSRHLDTLIIGTKGIVPHRHGKNIGTLQVRRA